MSRITTHVLDTALGKPAAGIAVRLEKEESGGWSEVTTHRTGKSEPRTVRTEDRGTWVEVNRSVTDGDGRCRDLIENAAAGRYRLIFEVGPYFERLRRTSLYSEIAIVFTCSGHEHYHLPLLLSDNGYTTYRGS
ncbi:MAG TPA: hydroxyisourate hydrolase [Terracidiphilus sp.]|nr:hydroxyisourate hydrolase [Terracidiphilus sp.]